MEKETKLYEIGYLMNPGISEEQVLGEINALRNIIEKKGGVITVEEKAKLIKLAYAIKKIKIGKFETAYFGWIKFMAETEAIIEIKNEADRMENLVRFMIIVGNDEQAQPRAGKRTYTKKEEKVEDKQQVNEEEVDKKIEELIGA
jgi:ribosomal protein S6